MRILVASSDHETRERLGAFCEASGVGVIEASSSGEALEAALIWDVAGAVVDLVLDGGPGHRVAELIHQCLPSLPLVVITEEGATELSRWAGAHGVTGWLRKSCDPLELRRALELIHSRKGQGRVAEGA